MMKAILLLTGVAACAPVPPATEPVQLAACSVDGVTDAVGKAYSAALGDRTRVRSGAKTVRVIRPGMAVTMDYRTDRLNIDLDEKDVITRLHCG